MEEQTKQTKEEKKLLELYRTLTDFERYWIMIYVSHLLAKREIEKERNK